MVNYILALSSDKSAGLKALRAEFVLLRRFAQVCRNMHPPRDPTSCIELCAVLGCDSWQLVSGQSTRQRTAHAECSSEFCAVLLPHDYQPFFVRTHFSTEFSSNVTCVAIISDCPCDRLLHQGLCSPCTQHHIGLLSSRFCLLQRRLYHAANMGNRKDEQQRVFSHDHRRHCSANWQALLEQARAIIEYVICFLMCCPCLILMV